MKPQLDSAGPWLSLDGIKKRVYLIFKAKKFFKPGNQRMKVPER
jgi:hypothetical protein